ncbi:MAG TPA: DMT family transporter [Candidatus Saccharimonadales bacterium]|nr:DMT family transporter [Candidatus Saccharimonadales bacterium]
MAVVASALLFGTLAVYGTYAQRERLTIVTLLSLRFLIAAVVLWAVVVVRGQLRWPGVRRVAQLGTLGLLFVGQSACYFLSLRSVPAAVTSILLYVYPIVVVLLGWLLFRERLSLRSAGALLVATFGVVLVVGVTPSGRLDVGGVAWGIGAGLLYAMYIVVGKRVLNDVTPLLSMAAVLTTAAATLLAYGAITGSIRSFVAAGWLTVFGAALLPTVLGATLFLFGLSRIGPTRASILSTLEPVATGVLASMLLAERISATRAVGGGCVLVAAALVATGTEVRRDASLRVAH